VVGYSVLVREESAALARRWLARLLLGAFALALLIVTMVAASVSATLGLTGLVAWSWALWTAPLTAAVITLIGLLAVWMHARAPHRGLLGEQLHADLELMQTYLEAPRD
jgi:hypothetical protein